MLRGLIMKMMLIIDPGLFAKGGHEHVMNAFLVEEAKRRGFQPMVLAHKLLHNTPVGFPLKGVFSFTPYEKECISAEFDRNLIQKGNKETFQVLSTLYPSQNLPQGSVILLHTACNTLLGGLLQWLRKIRRTDIKVRIVLRWPACRRVFDKTYAEQFCRKAVKAYQGLRCDVRFYSDSKRLVDYYERLTDTTFHQTPIGIHFQGAPELTKKSDHDTLHYVFAGVNREEKGFLQVIDVISPYLTLFPEDQFTLHVIDNEPLKRALESKNPGHLHCETNYLSGVDYFSFLMRGDVVLIPYDPKSYYLRTSHICMEALGLGRAVIVSGDSWMEDVVGTGAGAVGVVMREWTTEALFDALQRFRHQRSEILTNAYQQAPLFQQQHNPTAWMDLMLIP